MKEKLATTRASGDRWAYGALALIVAVAGVAYSLGIKLGLVHDYYSAAVYSMSKDWSSFLWGSVDGGSITVDKLPGALWIQALSVRLFGFNDWAVLGPQMVESLLAVVVVFFTVRRWLRDAYGAGAANVAGLLAAAGLATTPIVAALAHAEISDTLLMLTLSLAAYTWTRAMEKGSWKWLALTGFFVGWAFQSKMAEAWGILPSLALTYLAFAPGGFVRRLWHTVVAGVSAAVFSLWWIVLVSITPADARPWIDGSADNSAWSMVFEYNLSGRYEEAGAGGGESWSYLFGSNVATQAGWFYLTAVVGLIVALWYTRKSARTSIVRSAALMTGLWFATFFVAFSVGRVMHSYYVIAFAPAVVMLTALGAIIAWKHNRVWVAVMALAGIGWAAYLSNQFSTFYTVTIPIIVVLGIVGLLALVASRRLRFAAPIAALMLTVASLTTPAVWAASTVQSSYSGSAHGPAAGPVSSMGGMGGSGGAPSGSGGPGSADGSGPGSGSGSGSSDGQMQAPSDGGQPPSGMQAPSDGSSDASTSTASSTSGHSHSGGMTPPSGSGSGSGSSDGATPPSGGSMGGSQGGPGGASSFDASSVLDYIRSNDPGSTYDAVVIGYSAASNFITSGGNVILAGGYSGDVNNLTLDQLKELINSGQVHYIYLGGGGHSAGSIGGSDGTDSSDSSSAVDEITAWVEANCTQVSDSGTSNLYECTSAS
ncbi:glycosyltransferase family 39 protein [Corynebacterium vitaeruminis]|uniref:Uncharacterized protein n=1 Tax=Corynebacterium vitaeruminis DSM 20294 TaxID=1224164 RepID=W5XYR5_9CORY|nr:glycosyltransferase family 39 protein [Corynebacterium vitaeruminis]AHI21815.1 hypothetical protein B843_02115 [Corynebacterium vitaeruminis DSM 20294]